MEHFSQRVWESGFGGKVFFVLVVLAFSAPFIFDTFAVVAVWLWVWPGVTTVAEKLAVLSFLFVVLNAVASSASRQGQLLWRYAFFMRPKRWRKKRKGPGREDPA